MDSTTAKALDEALALAEDSVQVSLGLQTKAAELERQLVGEKVLLEKVASAEKRANTVITFDPGLINQAAQVLVQVGGGEAGDAVKLASSIAADPNVVLHLLVKVDGSAPSMRAAG
ncbi:MAG: hypothetical protein RL077_648 [Verrucomicrobiota bacterium]|jgi:glycerol dehydrogenase-like iron-containing ADH family enzyme